MSVLFGATVFFNKPEELAVIRDIARQFPAIKYVEFRGELPFLYPGNTSTEQLNFYREVVKQSGLRCTIHTTMYDVNLSTLNPWIKEANIACYRQYIDFAEILGAEIIVVHGGVLYREFADSPLREQFYTRARNSLVESLAALAEYAAPRNVKIALENSPPKNDEALVFDAPSLISVLKEVNRPNVGALFDFAHANLRGLNLLQNLKEIRPYLFEIHAHNNEGNQDDHMGLHHGVIDYLEILKQPEVQNIPFIMEIRSAAEVLATLQWLAEKKLL